MISTIEQAWHRFVESGSCDEHDVPPPILRSWKRCAAANLDPYHLQIPGTPAALLRDKEYAGLVNLARPAMEDLYQFVEGSGFAVLLFDVEPKVIEIIGDNDILARIHELGLGIGASWSEAQIGTMAVNLTLHEALPQQTQGFEHYHTAYHQLACSAAPLFNINGQAIGVIGVLGQADAAHAHTLGMVIATGQAIHAQARNNLLLAETNDHLAELNAAIEAMSDGMIMLDAEGRVSKLNARAAGLLGVSARTAAGHLFDDLINVPDTLRETITNRQELIDRELLFAGNKGAIAALCNVHPVLDRSHRHIGILITLRPPESVARLLQHVAGNEARFTFADIVGESPAMQSALRHARVAALSNTPVLIYGEPGVGKQLFAHAIHNAGIRADGPFITVNCSAISRSLIIGELFGYEGDQGLPRNAEYPGDGRPGRLELARGGTLVLEDIGSLPVEAQTSLLRAIETGHLIRVGGRRVVPLEARIIAISHHNLQDEISKGRFRSELYYRLAVQTISIPPLRKRGDDLLLLINHMLSSLNRQLGKQSLLAPDALDALLHYPWPGNVGELDSVLEQILDLSENTVLTIDDLPLMIASIAQSRTRDLPAARLHDRHAVAERDAILSAGREVGGHLGRLSSRLGISRATLWRKMKLYGISKEHFWASAGEKSPR